MAQYVELKLIGDTDQLDEYGTAVIFSRWDASLYLETEQLSEEIAKLVQQNFRIIAITPQQDVNYHTACPEVWARETIGRFTVIPVEGSNETPHNLDGVDIPLYVIPGMGFGTGHHPTTNTVLSFIQSSSTGTFTEAIDIGTGSGLIAIGIAKLYGIPVFAFDNDAEAVNNAHDNVELNHVNHLVTLETIGIEACQRPAVQLVCANLYSELLIQYQQEIARLVSPQGVLILSGITESRGVQVIETFRELGFILTLEKHIGGWVTLLFTSSS